MKTECLTIISIFLFFMSRYVFLFFIEKASTNKKILVKILYIFLSIITVYFSFVSFLSSVVLIHILTTSLGVF